MANQPSKYLIVILGPTAVGKTEMGVLLARHFDAQVLSADSRQLYREMRIGTALPDRDQLGGVMHHFLGNLSIHEDYNVFRYEQEAIELLGNIYLEHDIALLDNILR